MWKPGLTRGFSVVNVQWNHTTVCNPCFEVYWSKNTICYQSRCCCKLSTVRWILATRNAAEIKRLNEASWKLIDRRRCGLEWRMPVWKSLASQQVLPLSSAQCVNYLASKHAVYCFVIDFSHNSFDLTLLHDWWDYCHDTYSIKISWFRASYFYFSSVFNI